MNTICNDNSFHGDGFSADDARKLINGLLFSMFLLLLYPCFVELIFVCNSEELSSGKLQVFQSTLWFSC